MSNFSQAHNIISNEDGKAVALTGQRLVTQWWKQTEAMKAAGKAAHKPIAASIPQLQVTQGDFESLKPYIQILCEDAQDKIVRARAESGFSEVTSEQLSIPAIVSYLESVNTSSRLTKESICAWFDTSGIADALTISLADKLGFPDTLNSDQELKLTQMINVVREKIASLSGSKTTFSVPHATKLIEVIKFAPSDDLIAAKFISRLEAMKNQDSDIFDSL